MQLVEKHIVNKSHPDWSECEQLCQNSNTIRNQGLYIQRQSWFYGHGVVKFGKTELHQNIDALMLMLFLLPYIACISSSTSDEISECRMDGFF
ncbi:hypothetical protein [Tolypothrix sp. VBCCA 56010]|uniref:hypothetical protein n=1 Tax=Tolypothrix sp. VBCCA 56010 TaxID=3137731 RepID=UPI003D7E08E5